MSQYRIKKKKPAPAGDLSGWPIARLEAEIERLDAAWMARRQRGVRNTWRHWEERERIYVALETRRYGPAGVERAKADLAGIIAIWRPNDD